MKKNLLTIVLFAALIVAFIVTALFTVNLVRQEQAQDTPPTSRIVPALIGNSQIINGTPYIVLYIDGELPKGYRISQSNYAWLAFYYTCAFRLTGDFAEPLKCERVDPCTLPKYATEGFNVN